MADTAMARIGSGPRGAGSLPLVLTIAAVLILDFYAFGDGTPHTLGAEPGVAVSRSEGTSHEPCFGRSLPCT